MSAPGRFIFGAVVGSGLTAQAIDRVGVDFLLVLNAGRLRVRGASSLSAYLPLNNANDWVLGIGEREILHRCNAPVLAGLSLSDPEIDPEALAERVRELGFAGVAAFPSAATINGSLRVLLEELGLGFQRECAFIRAAAAAGLRTLAYAGTNVEAHLMAEAGASMICAVAGFTGGATGVDTHMTLEATAAFANRVLDGLPRRIVTLVEGGPITSPEDVTVVTRLSKVGGYLAGSTIDRLPIEAAVTEVTRSFRIISQLREKADATEAGSPLIGNSSAMRELRALLPSVARAELPVFIRGETGTGKTAVAQELHRLGATGGRVPVVVDCAALPPDLGTVQMMGQAVGLRNRDTSLTRGAFELADGTSLMLEEVAALGADQQSVLLRFAESGYVQRIGGLEGRSVKTRLIATSNQDIEGAIAAGRFRADLYYRLAGFEIVLPPLRQRRDDIPELVEHFARVLARGKPPRFSNGALRILVEHDWPGNVRELQNAVRRVLSVLAGDTVTARDVGFIEAKSSPEVVTAKEPLHTMPETERDWILAALKRNRFRKGDTARELGISERTLYNKMRLHHLR